MSDKRDERVDERLYKMSTLIEHSGAEKDSLKSVDKEFAKNDILNELPEEIRRYLLHEGYSFGDNVDSLREAYRDYKAQQLEVERMRLQGDRRFSERRQDNSRDERFNPKDRQYQNEHTHSRY